MDNTLAIMISEAKRKVQQDKSLKERLKSAMKITFRHWLVTDEDSQFRAAIGAVLLSASESEKKKITTELKGLRAISAMTNGVPIDIAQLIKNQEGAEPVGLLKLWKEIKGNEKAT